jgi:hypothetical protein
MRLVGLVRVALNEDCRGVGEEEAHATLRRRMRRILLTIVLGDKRCLERRDEEDRMMVIYIKRRLEWMVVGFYTKDRVLGPLICSGMSVQGEKGNHPRMELIMESWNGVDHGIMEWSCALGCGFALHLHDV